MGTQAPAPSQRKGTEACRGWEQAPWDPTISSGLAVASGVGFQLSRSCPWSSVPAHPCPGPRALLVPHSWLRDICGLWAASAWRVGRGAHTGLGGPCQPWKPQCPGHPVAGGGRGAKLKGRIWGMCSELLPAPWDRCQGPHVDTPAPWTSQRGCPQRPLPELRADQGSEETSSAVSQPVGS